MTTWAIWFNYTTPTGKVVTGNVAKIRAPTRDDACMMLDADMDANPDAAKGHRLTLNLPLDDEAA